ncbi:MAG: cation diffusion facilitator family transporter [Dehalococcoidales bacterium]|nr:cation diffusion facilitator family transporter [Dehalococcoidales bacterium]
MQKIIKFIRGFFSPSKSSYESKQRSILTGLLFGIIGLFPAIAIVIVANSLTVFSDLLRNVGVVFAIFFSWMTIQKIAKGKNAVYNYGYGKMENLSSLVVAGVMLISIIIILYQIIDRFQNPVEIHAMGLGIGVFFSALAALFNGWLWWQSYKTAKSANSPMMESLWRLYQVKTISTICVVASLGLSLLFRNYSWAVYIDPAGSIVMLGVLIFSTYGVISSSVYDLLDRALSDSLQLIVLRSLATHFNAYEAIHGVNSRRSGNNVYVELLLEFDPESKMADVQNNIDEMKHELESNIPGSQVTIVPTRNPLH